MPLEDTLDGVKRILSGDFDSLPENAFFMVGDVQEAVAKAKLMTRQQQAFCSVANPLPMTNMAGDVPDYFLYARRVRMARNAAIASGVGCQDAAGVVDAETASVFRDIRRELAVNVE